MTEAGLSVRGHVVAGHLRAGGNAAGDRRRDSIAELVKILNMPDVRERMETLGVDPVANSSEEFAAFQKAEIAKWAKVVKEGNVKIDCKRIGQSSDGTYRSKLRKSLSGISGILVTPFDASDNIAPSRCAHRRPRRWRRCAHARRQRQYGRVLRTDDRRSREDGACRGRDRRRPRARSSAAWARAWATRARSRKHRGPRARRC